jgi:hypothetical protein
MKRSGRHAIFRDGLILIAVLMVIGGLLWAARELCRASADCPWTVMY